jgi:hypothetical protein
MSDVLILDDFRRGRAFAPRGAAVASAPRRPVAVAAPAPAFTPADRDKRQEQWSAASARLEYWRALRELAAWIVVAELRGLRKCGDHPHLMGVDLAADHNAIIAQERAAMVDLLMTPAPFASSVLKKETILRSDQFKFLGVTERQAQAQIAADEAFLKACPRREKGTRRS